MNNSDGKSGALAPGPGVYRDTTVPKQQPADTSETSTTRSKMRQILASVCVSFGCLLNGSVIGYTSPAIPSLMSRYGKDIYGQEFIISAQQASWITGVLSLGSLAGCIAAAPTMDKIGRKKSLMWVTSVFFLLGYLLIAMANHVAWIYIGRFINGLGLGFQLAVATVYIVEIASNDMRGFLGCFIQLMGSLGVLFTFILGSQLPWHLLAAMNGVLAVFFFVAMSIVPESPRWLVLRGHEYSAFASLDWLRGGHAAVEREIDKIKRDIQARRHQHFSISQVQSAWKQLLVSITMMFIIQMSGLMLMVYYSVTIFQLSSVDMDPKMAAVLIGITLVVSSLLALAVVSRVDRKAIMVSSMAIMFICYLILALCFLYQPQKENPLMDIGTLNSSDSLNLTSAGITKDPTTDHVNKSGDINLDSDDRQDKQPTPEILGWLPLLAIIILLFAGNGGYGSLIWIVTAEIIPAKVRSVSNSIIICFGFLCGFFVSKTFVDLVQALGTSGTFFLYAGVCLFGTLFTLIFVPETRGKSMEEIQQFFHGKRRSHLHTHDSLEPNAVETPLRQLAS